MLKKEWLDLCQGWDGFKAQPPSTKAYENAESFLKKSLDKNLKPSRVEPSVMGGIGITYENDVYVEFSNNGKAVYSSGNSIIGFEKRQWDVLISAIKIV